MGRRTLLLVAALLLAAIGTGVLFVFLQATVKSTSSASGSRDTVTVAVPKAEIKEGTKIVSADLFQQAPVPPGLAQQAGYVRYADIAKYVDRVATRRLPALTPVTPSAFGTSVTGSSTIALAPGTMTIAVEVDDAARVGTFLYPGARTTLWLLTSTGNNHEARIVLPEVTVVTLGAQGTIVTPAPTPTRSGAAPRTSGIVVLQVDQEQAAKVLLAQQSGDLYFTLLGDKTTPSPRSYDDSLIG